MQRVEWEITEEEYKRLEAMSYGERVEEIESKIGADWKYGYGYYGHSLIEKEGKYYIVHSIGDSCD